MPVSQEELQKHKKEIELDLQKMERAYSKAKTIHILHLLLSLITAGVWLIVWLLVANLNAYNRTRLEKLIDESRSTLIDIDRRLSPEVENMYDEDKIVAEKCKTVSDNELKKYYNFDKKHWWKISVIIQSVVFLFGALIFIAVIIIDKRFDMIGGTIGFFLIGLIVLFFSIKQLRSPWREHALEEYKKAIYKKIAQDKSKSDAVKTKQTLVRCKACGATVSKMAETCVKCGENSPGLWIHCPQCQSLSVGTVKKGFGAKRSAAGYLIAGPIGLLLGQAGKEDTKLVCKECNYRWDFKISDIVTPNQKEDPANDIDHKQCVYCAEEIKAKAILCRFCGKKQPS